MSKKFSDCAIEDNLECKMNKMPKLTYAPLSAQRSTEQGSAPLTPNRSGKGGLLYSYLKEKLSIAKSQLSDEDNLKLQVESQPTYTPKPQNPKTLLIKNIILLSNIFKKHFFIKIF